MAHFSGLYLVFASIGLILCNVAVAQISSTTTVAAVSSTTVAPTPLPVSCENATPITINGTLFLGTWYEAARKPVGSEINTEECVQLIIARDATTVSVKITYSVDQNNLWINQTTTNTVVYNSQTSDSEVFEGFFSVTNNGITTNYKILQTDYSSFALICGYVPLNVASTVAPSSSTTVATPSSTVAGNSTVTPASTTAAPISPSPAGAFILTRERQISATQLANLSASALHNFMDFDNISTVIQSSQCYVSGASSTVPVLAMILAVVYSLLKFVH